ncbi:unnamed protein product [Alternaria alternata]
MNTLYPTRLSNSEVRLLHILPSESPESPVSCELQHYEIDDIPAYEALSYCWGDSADRREIMCNGAAHWVTTNLRDALVRLRPTNEARIVWADALCIAQSDEEEKSSQVRRMGSIFHRAKRVVVWLGHVETEHALDIKRVFDSLICVETFKDDPEHYLSDWRIPDVAAVFGGSLPWNALDLFFKITWFRRIWCIQEIRLASDSIFYWGTEELSRYIAVRLAGWMADRCQDELQHSPYTILEKYAWYMNGPLRRDKCNLLSALRTYRNWEATDPRDKIYGILGLMELEYWSEKVSTGSPLGHDPSPVMISMARTLTTGVVLPDDTLYECANEDEIVAYSQSFLAYIRLLHLIADNESRGGLPTQYLSEYDDSWMLFEDIMGKYCSRRKFFRTKNGSLGLGPACLQENDMIVVLEGAYNPCALRPKGDTYLLLGDVYMDEIRHGELIKEIEEVRKERQYFCLN